ncbi:15893_t:CDS:2, partial [Gigaspora margarita]
LLNMTQSYFLILFGTKLIDVGMSALKDLENLVKLYLDRTLITDAGIFKQNTTIRKSSFSNRKLKYLDVGYTRVTNKGVRELR